MSETTRPRTPDIPGVLLDLDGTLVDSVYQHVVAWHEAFRAHGYDVPQARIHAGIGMGSDRLVPWLLGRHVDDAEEFADDHKRRFLDRVETLRPPPGPGNCSTTSRPGVDFVIATSAGGEEREALLGCWVVTTCRWPTRTAWTARSPHPSCCRSRCDTAGFLRSAA
jgi:beta-phosphoglucomutase-like phosphatase (HAD superfamily)